MTGEGHTADVATPTGRTPIRQTRLGRPRLDSPEPAIPGGPLRRAVPAHGNHGGSFNPGPSNGQSVMSRAEEYVFFCPECGQEIEVNASMREALLANGCVICGAAVTDDAFSG